MLLPVVSHEFFLPCAFDWGNSLLSPLWNFSLSIRDLLCPGVLGDTQFSFRLRQSGGQRTTHYEDDGKYNREAPLTLQVGCLLVLCVPLQSEQ